MTHVCHYCHPIASKRSRLCSMCTLFYYLVFMLYCIWSTYLNRLYLLKPVGAFILNIHELSIIVYTLSISRGSFSAHDIEKD